MSKGDKIFVAVVGIVMVIGIFLLLRFNEMLPMGYHSLGLDGEYTEIKCYKRYGKKNTRIITDKDKIQECVDTLNEFEIRKPDLIDRILGNDGKTKKGYLGQSVRYTLVFVDKNGEETTWDFPYYVARNDDISYIGKLFNEN